MPTLVWDPDIQAALKAAAEREPFPSPTDWRDVWIYQIMLDRFNNPQRAPAHAPWDTMYGAFQGGTLDGVREQLGYLEQLGVGAIWLSPVMKNCCYCDTYHGYGIQDFLALDPRFASDPQQVEAEFRQLVEAAHARGIYVIADVILNHAGDVFEYVGHGSEAPWREWPPYDTRWRDESGSGMSDPPPVEQLSPDAAVVPRELYCDDHFRRQGRSKEKAEEDADETRGDFCSLKEMVTDQRAFSAQRGHHIPVRDILIRAHQYFVAKYDVDGFRVDTLKHIEPDFARTFANAMREMALSIGKRNFFVFGEVYGKEDQIARFIGRSANETGEPIGVDAALDFPLFHRLPEVAKGFVPPGEVSRVFQNRKEEQRGLVSTHGDASKFFVTFLDNHDQKQRFYYSHPDSPRSYDDQLTLGVACLFALQGIPCLYYGTEQGLCGTQELYAGGVELKDEVVREALWGKDSPVAFDPSHPFYRAIEKLSEVRSEAPALRYGRQYFRPISVNGWEFGISWFPQGVLSFSRILNDEEIVVVANTHTTESRTVEVIVDFALNPPGSAYEVLFTNLDPAQATPPGAVTDKVSGSVTITEVTGAITHGPARTLPVTLRPMEVQYLRK
jgi:glycosidase